MKKLASILSCLACFITSGFCQGDCGTQKIITAAVTKPGGLTVDLITCSTMVVKWQGVADQSYFVTAIRKDTVTQSSKDSIPASSISCDFAQQCKATISLPAGVTVRWIVTSSKIINSRIFYSYPATDDKMYNIPKCGDPVMNFPPVAGAWLAKFYSASSVLLAAWGSYDPEGQPIKYLWRKVSGPASYSMLYETSASPVISQLVNGTYGFELMVTDILGATAKDTVLFNVMDVHGIVAGTNVPEEFNINQAVAKLSIFPNPATNQFNVEWKTAFVGNAMLTIMDFSGKAVKQIAIEKTQTIYNSMININALKQGVYYLFIKSNDGRVVSERLYKN